MTGTGRLPRTIQLDASDTVVFATVAAPGEWAVSGTFLFAGRDPESFARKERIAFRTGFLGLASFGFSTLVCVSDADATEWDDAVEMLAGQLVARLGAPDAQTARAAALEEVAFAAELCTGHAVGTLIALHRGVDADGSMRERFRTLRPREDTSLGAGHLRGHDKAFFVVDSDEEEPAEAVDLLGLLKGSRR